MAKDTELEFKKSKRSANLGDLNSQYTDFQKRLEKVPGPTDKEILEQVIQGQTLPYTFGLTYVPKVAGTTLAGLASMGKEAYKAIKDKKYEFKPFENNVVSLNDLTTALNPVTSTQAPSLPTYAERLNIPKGLQVSDFATMGEPGKSAWYVPEKGGPLDVTARGLGAGFLEGLLSKENLGKLIAPTLKKVGKSMYQNAPTMKQLDQSSAINKKVPISEVLFENQIAGQDADIGAQAINLVPKYNTIRDQIISQIDEAGIRGDTSRALASAREYAQQKAASRLPEEKAIGEALLRELDTKYGSITATPASEVPKTGTMKAKIPVPEKYPGTTKEVLDPMTGQPVYTTVQKEIPYTSQETIPVPEVLGPTGREIQTAKSLSGGQLPKSAWDALSPEAQKFYVAGVKARGAGFKSELENMAGQLSPEAQQQLMEANAKQSALLAAAKKLNPLAYRKYSEPISSIDALWAGSQMASKGGEPIISDALGLAAKKIIDMKKATAPRTMGGLKLYNAGEAIQKAVPNYSFNPQIPVIDEMYKYKQDQQDKQDYQEYMDYLDSLEGKKK